MNVLIVDDHATNRKLLRAQLESEKMIVHEAEDGLAAMELLNRTHVDAVVSDILMPRMDGYRFCYEIRHHPRLESLPFIFYSATYTAPADEALAVSLGADKFLRKPASAEIISGSLRTVMSVPVRRQPPSSQGVEELSLLKQYSERLVAKLEEKNIELERRTEELRDMSEQFCQLVAHSPAVLYRLKIEGVKITPILVSDNIERLLGYSSAEAANYDWWLDNVHPEDRDRTEARGLAAFRSGGYQMEYRIRHKDGKYRWIEDQNRVAFDSSGNPKECVGIWTDITERKRAEEQMRVQFSALTAAANAIVITGLSGKIEWVNPAFTELTGYTAKEVVGENPRLLKSGQHSREFYSELWGTILAGNPWQGEVVNKRKNGSSYAEEMTITPVRNADGQIEHFVAIKQDISERKQAQDALAESQRRLQAIFDAAGDGIVLVEIETRKFRAANDSFCRMLGYSLEEVLELGLMDIHPAADLPRIVRQFEGGARGETGVAIDIPVKRKDGSVFAADVNSTTTTLDGKACVLGIFRDITERKRAELELEKTHHQLVDASRQAGMAEFATGILHNVGNILNSVGVASSCLAESLCKSKTANLAKVVALINEHRADLGGFLTADPKGTKIPGYLAQLADHLVSEQTAAVKELVELQGNIEHIKAIVTTQQNAARNSAARETLNLSELVDDALKLNRNALARSNIEVVRDFQTMPPMTVSKHAVLQILINVVRNAMQACEGVSGTKQISARVSRKNGFARISISDTGCGISAENLHRIFSHGFTTKKDGHGFGLHSARQAAKEMGGSLSVTSDGPGRGATFMLELPA